MVLENQEGNIGCKDCLINSDCNLKYKMSELPPCGAQNARQLFAASFIEFLNWINENEVIEIGAIRIEPKNANEHYIRVVVKIYGTGDKVIFDEVIDKFGSNVEDAIFKMKSRITKSLEFCGNIAAKEKP